MGTTDIRRRNIGRALALAVAAATVALPFFAAPPASAAPPPPAPLEGTTLEGSVDLPSFPVTKTLSVPQIDPTVVDIFALTKVTVTATVDGALTGHVENLSSSVSKTLTFGADVGITVEDSDLIDTLAATASISNSVTVAPGGTEVLDFAGSDSDTTELTGGVLDELLGLLVGTETINFDVSSLVSTDIAGPAPYLSTGVANGTATVTIDYEYVEACPYNEELPVDDPECVPPPPPECVTITKIDGLGTLQGGEVLTSEDENVELTIEAVNADKSFDWSSNVTIFWISVKGGPGGEPGDVLTDTSHFLTEYEGGATSGTAHAPLNESTPTAGDFYDASHLHICYEPGEEVCEWNPQLPPDSPYCVPPQPECVDLTKIDDLPDPLVEDATYTSDDGNVELTIDALHSDKSFDWTSNVPIVWMSVKGGPGDGELFEDLGGATSGTAHAPLNDNSEPDDDYFAASHIDVCYEPGEEVCEWNPQLPPDSPYCVPPVDECEWNPELPADHEDCEPPVDECPDMPGDQSDPAQCDPPPECVDTTKIDDLPDPLVQGHTYTSDDGNVELTITALHGDKSFDWSSNVSIFWMDVKGGSSDGALNEYPGGQTSGTAAHAPLNDNTNKDPDDFYAASHITLCYEPEVEEKAALQQHKEQKPAVKAKKNDAPGVKDSDPDPVSKSQPSSEPSPAPEPKSDPAPEPEPAPEPKPAPEPEPKQEPEPEPAAKETKPPAAAEKAKTEDDDGDDTDDGDDAGNEGKEAA